MHFSRSSNSPLLSLPHAKAPFVLTTARKSHNTSLYSPPPPSPSLPSVFSPPHSSSSTPFPTLPQPSHTPHALSPTPSPPTSHSLQLHTIHQFLISPDNDSNAHKYHVFGSSPPPPIPIKPNLPNPTSPPPLLSSLTSPTSSASLSSNSLSSLHHIPSLSDLSLLTSFDCSFTLSSTSSQRNLPSPPTAQHSFSPHLPPSPSPSLSSSSYSSSSSNSSLSSPNISNFHSPNYLTRNRHNYNHHPQSQYALLFFTNQTIIPLTPTTTTSLPILLLHGHFHHPPHHPPHHHPHHQHHHHPAHNTPQLHARMYPHSPPPTPTPPPPHSPLPPIRTPSRSPSPRKLTSSSPSSPPSNTSVAPTGTHTAQFATRSSPDHRSSQLISESIRERRPLAPTTAPSASQPTAHAQLTNHLILLRSLCVPRVHNKHNPAPPSLPPPPLTTHYQSTRLASANTTATTTTTNNTTTANSTSRAQQTQTSALLSPMLSANTTTAHSYLHFPGIHHQTSHQPPSSSTTPTPPMTPQTAQPRRQHRQCASLSFASNTAFPTAAPTPPPPPPSPNPLPISLLSPPGSTPSLSPPQANQLRFLCMGCHRDFTTECAWRSHLQFPHPPSQLAPPCAILASHGVASMAPPLSTSTPRKSPPCTPHTRTHSAQPSSLTHAPSSKSTSNHTSLPSLPKPLPLPLPPHCKYAILVSNNKEI
nr:conserved hypothetical protein [Hymenolepis microstoma]